MSASLPLMPSDQPPRRKRRLTGGGGAASRYFDGFLHNILQKSYAGDIIGLVILASSNAILMSVREPFHRMFYLDDPKLSFPHAEHERVPVPMLLVLSVVVPLGAIVAWAGAFKRGGHFMTVSILGLSTSLLMASFFTDVVKNYVGSPRPDLISRCIPKPGTPQHALVSYDVCTQTAHHTLEDGFRSFPSGHSSLSFAGLFYLSLFLTGQMHILHRGADLTRICFAWAPSILALTIVMSRLEDYRHDYYDVTAGTIIGIVTALFAYRRYFPALKSEYSEVPYPGNDDGNEGYKSPDRLEDLEMGRV